MNFHRTGLGKEDPHQRKSIERPERGMGWRFNVIRTNHDPSFLPSREGYLGLCPSAIPSFRVRGRKSMISELLILLRVRCDPLILLLFYPLTRNEGIGEDALT